MSRQPLRVLLVEDNADDAALVVRQLQQGRYDLTWERVDSAAGVQAALARQPWDIVISDYSMPQFDGLAALQMVKAHDDNLPFILVSGTVGEDIAVGAMQAGAGDYVMKDKPTRLLPAVRRELAEAEERRKRQAAEDEVRKSQQDLAKAQAIAHVGSWTWDLRTNAEHWSDEQYRIFGYRPQEVPATFELFCRTVHPDDWATVQRAIEADLKDHQPYETEFRIIRPDGNIRWIYARAETSRDAQGTPLFMAGIVQDLTDRKQAEEAVQAAARHWHNTFAAVNDSLLILDAEQRVLQCNRAAEVLLAKPAAAIVGRPCWEVVHGATAPVPECPVAKLRQSLRHETEELAFDSKCWAVGVDPVLDEHGKLAGVVHTTRDITEYKNLQSQLFQAQKMESIGQLAGGVAHDFNNLLQAIMGYTELLLEQTPRTDARHGDLAEIFKTSQRAAALTRQLLAFARKQAITPTALDLNEAIEGILKMLRRLIGEHIELVWMPGASLWPTWMDPAQIDQILANLLVNARDAIGSQGKITINTGNQTLDLAACTQLVEAIPGDYALLTVRDTGCGMTKEILARIFEPFFTTKGVGQGTGMGLATVYGIVKQNHGFLSVQSAPGQGTAFHIYLPRHAGAAGAIPAHAHAVELPRSRGETVLLVEDELTILSLGQRILERVGYTVLVANTPGDALKLAGEHAGVIHLLLTDVVMPDLSGRELAQQLLAGRPQLKSLFMSGYTADIIAHHGVLEEGLNFIQKPFNVESLAIKVRAVLDGQ